MTTPRDSKLNEEKQAAIVENITLLVKNNQYWGGKAEQKFFGGKPEGVREMDKVLAKKISVSDKVSLLLEVAEKQVTKMENALSLENKDKTKVQKGKSAQEYQFCAAICHACTEPTDKNIRNIIPVQLRRGDDEQPALSIHVNPK